MDALYATSRTRAGRVRRVGQINRRRSVMRTTRGRLAVPLPALRVHMKRREQDKPPDDPMRPAERQTVTSPCKRRVGLAPNPKPTICH